MRSATRVALLLSGLVATIVALGACSSGGAESDTTMRPPDSVLAVDPSANQGWARLSSFQRDMLADGELTFDEYERAVLATVECLEEKGYVVDPPPHLDGSGKRLDWSTQGSPGTDIETMRRDSEGCDAAHSGYVRHYWSLMHAPSAQERRAAEVLVEQCVAESGVEMPQIGTDAWGQWMASGAPAETNFFQCVADIAAETGVELGR